MRALSRSRSRSLAHTRSLSLGRYGHTMAPMQYAGVAIVVFAKKIADVVANILGMNEKKPDEKKKQ